MKIIIYEKDEVLIDFIARVTKNYVTDEGNGVFIKLATSDNSKIIKECMRVKVNNYEPTLYFLGTSVKKFNDGIDLGETLRKLDPLGYIVFVSDSSDAGKYIDYSIRAFDYFLKPVGLSEFTKLLNRVDFDFSNISNTIISQIKRSIIVSSGYKEIAIPINDIIALEHNKPRTTIYYKQGETTGYFSLKDIEDKIFDVIPRDESTFIRTHKSYIINMINISTIDQKANILTTVNGKMYPISRARKKEVKEAVDAFRGVDNYLYKD